MEKDKNSKYSSSESESTESEDSSDNETIVAESDEEIEKVTYNYTSKEYLDYKELVLQLKINEQSEKQSSGTFPTIFLKGKTLLKLCQTIKLYGTNLLMNNGHIEKIKTELLNDEYPLFIQPLVLFQYTDYEADDYRNLIELADGHHRLKAIKLACGENKNLYRKLAMPIYIIDSDYPDSPKTNKLFANLNKVKPFSSMTFLDISKSIIKELNSRFNGLKKLGFVFIKDGKQRANKPSFLMSEFSETLQSKLAEMNAEDKYDFSKLSVEAIGDKFVEYNESLKLCDVDYDNFAKQFGLSKGKQARGHFERAKKFNCYIGLFECKEIIKKCLVIPEIE